RGRGPTQPGRPRPADVGRARAISARSRDQPGEDARQQTAGEVGRASDVCAQGRPPHTEAARYIGRPCGVITQHQPWSGCTRHLPIAEGEGEAQTESEEGSESRRPPPPPWYLAGGTVDGVEIGRYASGNGGPNRSQEGAIAYQQEAAPCREGTRQQRKA